MAYISEKWWNRIEKERPRCYKRLKEAGIDEADIMAHGNRFRLSFPMELEVTVPRWLQNEADQFLAAIQRALNDEGWDRQIDTNRLCLVFDIEP